MAYEAEVTDGSVPDICYILATSSSEAASVASLWVSTSEEDSLRMRRVIVFGNATEAREDRRPGQKIYEYRVREIA